MTNIISNIDRDKSTWVLPDTVTSNILDSLIKESKKEYNNNKNAFSDITLNLSKTKYIDIEGALSLICFCSAIKRKNRNTIFHFIYPEGNVLNYLMSLGFFGQMSNKVGVLEGQNIVHYENELRHKRKLKQKIYSINSNLKPIILPIETIEQKRDTIGSGANFEHMIGAFASHALDTFNELLTTPEFDFDGEDYYQFRESNIELYKNIFQHSKSWGLATIHARPDFGTTVCYYDIGIGFKASIGKFDTEIESIEWALIDGNTSKQDGDNDGFGFTLIQEFVFKRNGNIKIRSGECLLQLSYDTTKKKNIVSYFPGVQISYFIPA